MLGNRDVRGAVFRLPYNQPKSGKFLRRSRCLLVGSAFASSDPGVAATETASAAAACDGGLARCSSFVHTTVSQYYECMYEYAESTLLLLLLLLLFLLVSRTKNTRESKVGVHTAPQNALLQAMTSRLNATNLILSETNL